MAVLTDQQRRILQQIKRKRGLTRSEIDRELTGKSKKAQAAAAAEQTTADTVIDNLVNNGYVSVPTPSANNPDPPVTITEQGELELGFYLSYQRLRTMIGSMAIALPFVLPIGYLITGGNGLLGSISSYYYTDMRNIFVGTLCAIGGSLIAYKDAPWQFFPTKLAAVAAILVAFFPTNQGDTQSLVGTLHMVFAISLFILLGISSVFILTKADIAKGGYCSFEEKKAKKRRNAIYMIFGGILLACGLLELIVGLLPRETSIWLFWVEALGLFFFGLTWVIKGNRLIGNFRYFSP